MKTISAEAAHRRFWRLTNAVERRMAKCLRLPAGSSERREAAARFNAWRDRVFKPLDRRLFALMRSTGQASVI